MDLFLDSQWYFRNCFTQVSSNNFILYGKMDLNIMMIIKNYNITYLNPHKMYYMRSSEILRFQTLLLLVLYIHLCYMTF